MFLHGKKAVALFISVALVTFLFIFKGCSTYPSKKVLNLSKADWHFAQADSNLEGKAFVPGSVQMDLLKNKLIPPPYYRTNENKLQWIGEKDWIYFTSFSVPATLLRRQKIDLIFKGLDTFAEIFLNDSLILKSDNFFRSYSVDVTRLLKPKNKLKIFFHSPLKVIEKKKKEEPIPLTEDYAYVRKPAYHFGWDWGPRFITEGIWQPVELIAWSVAEIKDVQVVQRKLTKEKALLDFVFTVKSEVNRAFELQVKCLTTGKSVAKRVQLKNGNNKKVLRFVVENPKRWWTNGRGEPFLYSFLAELNFANNTIDKKPVRTGLRTLRLVQKPDSLGKSFYFELNGVPLFAKGANYIPQDVFLNRPTKEQYERLILQVKNANMNMLRVWGGGFYEKDLFYDLCDENGILVWQDFMFACSMYPGSKEFISNVQKEAIENVVRLRNHPCIALWCGNNEVAIGWKDWGWPKNYSRKDSAKLYGDYKKLFENVLPSVVSRFDSGRAYWSSSPLFGWGYPVYAGGDVHYWGVWHGQQTFENFEKKKYIGRFMSEYGFQSCPELSSIKKFTLPEDRELNSTVMLLHQKHRIGYPVIDKYLKWYYKWPKNFDSYLYVSQALQAYGIGKAIESHRRTMPFCMGTLYWQLNDCYPVASWSSIDYYGKRKALYFKVKELYSPILISPKRKGNNVKILIVSDKLKGEQATLNLTLMNFAGEKLKGVEKPVIIKPNTSKVYFTFNIQQLLEGADTSSVFLKIKLAKRRNILAKKYFFFVFPKNLKLKAPQIKVCSKAVSQGFSLTLSSKSLAKDVFLATVDGEGEFDNNFFDLIPTEPITVFLKTEAKNFNPSKELLIYSLYDSYEK